METVYFIDCASYESGRMIGPYTSKAIAERVLEVVKRKRFAFIKELQVDRFTYEIELGFLPFYVCLDNCGEPIVKPTNSMDQIPYLDQIILEVTERQEVHGFVWAKTEEEAIGLAQKFRMEKIW